MGSDHGVITVVRGEPRVHKVWKLKHLIVKAAKESAAEAEKTGVAVDAVEVPSLAGLQRTLKAALPNIIAINWQPHGDAHLTTGVVQEILHRSHDARESSRRHHGGARAVS